MRRFRASPRAPAAGALNVGVTLVRTGATAASNRATAAPADPGETSSASCGVPVSMRWRYFRLWNSEATSTVDPGASPPEWPYVFRSFATSSEIYSSTDDPLTGAVAAIANADTVRFALNASNYVTYGGGHWVVDLIDADGNAIDMIGNYESGCFGDDADGLPEVIEWVVRFVQFNSGGASFSIPNVTRLPTGELSLIVDPSQMVPGTLTISAIDHWSPSAPQEFGPLTFVYGGP